MKKNTLLFILTCCLISFAYSQDNDTLVMKKNAIRDVYGVVKIKGSDISLTNANISVIGSNFKTQTDSQGNFMIPNVKGDIKIAITAKNFVSRESIIPSDTDVVMFSLEPDPISYTTSLQSGGMGDIPMAMLSEGGSFIKLDPDKSYNSISLYSRLGTLPGVMVTSTGINIRGAVGTAANKNGSRGIIQKSVPLIIVDGVRYGRADRRGIIEIFDLVGVDDIAMITLLKGAECVIYGSAGGDGVIIITTRNYLISKMLLNAEKEARRAEDYKRREAKRIAKQNEKNSTLLK